MTLSLEQRLRSALESHPTRSEGVDMSAASVTHRLMELAEMSSVCLALGALAMEELERVAIEIAEAGAASL